MSVGSTNSQQTWTDGLNVGFRSWYPGEPNNGPNSRGALAAGSFSKGNWADVYSNDRFAYICELPCLEYEVSQ
ncbi:Lectin 1 [Holothuria leucospilota]|uniref:Lectin 1 n=1 Tax=Holothuria leucospilota TaxID=206669 RepID=A0A9Q1HIY9_HOLLE|nr:Lectin 1 [Holothuria leucospilota]